MQANVTKFLLRGHRAYVGLTPRKDLCRYASIPTTQIIFVHIPKIGGTSIRNALECCSEDIRPCLNDDAKIMVANRHSAGLSTNPPHISLVGAAKMLYKNEQSFWWFVL